ncbi:MAG: hypothetical protein Q7J54_07120 [Candidatus Woesearchaeota archaeon]|nr:hypothetical protein [Candidatus Woesearchaeota archaeon]
MESRSLFNRLDRFSFSKYLIAFGFIVMSAAFYMALVSGPAKAKELYAQVNYRASLISKLSPYVELTDNAPGISFKDQVDLAVKCDIPTFEVMEGKPINFDAIPTSKLENAVAAYESKQISSLE